MTSAAGDVRYENILINCKCDFNRSTLNKKQKKKTESDMLDNDNIKSGNVSEAVEKIRQMKKIIKRSLCIIVCYVKSKGRLETSSTAQKIKLRHSLLVIRLVICQNLTEKGAIQLGNDEFYTQWKGGTKLRISMSTSQMVLWFTTQMCKKFSQIL